MKKKIEIEIEPIIIYDESVRETFVKLFKEHKRLIMTQLLKGTNFNKNTIRTELQRMVGDGLLINENKPVCTAPNLQARSMTVYTWIGDKKKNGRKQR